MTAQVCPVKLANYPHVILTAVTNHVSLSLAFVIVYLLLFIEYHAM